MSLELRSYSRLLMLFGCGSVCFLCFPLHMVSQSGSISLQLVVKGSTVSTRPFSGFFSVFSPNEKFAAIVNSASLGIYDLNAGVETRKYQFAASSNLNWFATYRQGEFLPLYFTGDSASLIFQDGSRIMDCPASGHGQCSIVVDGARASAVSGNLLLFVTADNMPALRDLGGTKPDVQIEELVSPSDRAKFTWSTVSFYRPASNTQLALLGGQSCDPAAPRTKVQKV